MRHIHRYLLALLLFSSVVYGQESNPPEAIEPIEDSLKKKNEWKFLFGFDARTSWVLGEKSGLAGLKIGATLNKKHNFGVGIYFLKQQIVRGGVTLDPVEFPDATDTTSYNFGYSSLFYEPIWYNSRRLSLSTPFHYGTATVTASYKRSDTTAAIWTQYFTERKPLVEVSGVATYKVFRWFAFGVGGGYRFVLSEDQQVRRALSGPVVIFQAKVMLGVLYKLAFKKPIDDGWDEGKD